MTERKGEDTTQRLIAEGEALRSPSSSSEKKPPRTRQLVRDAERLIGREPVAPGVKGLLRTALLLALLAAGLAALFLLFA